MKSDANSDESSRPFAKEIYFYSVIVPAFEYFEEIKNVPEIDRIDGFPRYFGSRFSLDPSKSLNIPEPNFIKLIFKIFFKNIQVLKSQIVMRYFFLKT